MKLLFSLEAVSSMLVECYRGNHNQETGGILVGLKEHKGVVTDAIPSSMFAERKTATYYQSAQDVEILNQKLREYQIIGQDFVGYYHRHPSGFYRLSQGDLNTCEEIFESPNYKINNFLIMCIITESHVQDFPLFSYVVSLDVQGRVGVKKVGVNVLPKTCILECAECFGSVEVDSEWGVSSVNSIKTFEPSKEDNHDGKSVKPDIQRVEKQKPRRIVRNQGQRIGHHKRPRIDTRA